MRTLLAIGCCVALTGVTPTAQTISSDVMKILTRGSLSGMGENYDLTVGALPDGFPAALVPSGAKPVAATVSPSTTTLVVELFGAPAAVQVAHRKAFATTGWLNSMPAQRGFTRSHTVADLQTISTPLDTRIDLFMRVTRPASGRGPLGVTSGLTIRR